MRENYKRWVVAIVCSEGWPSKKCLIGGQHVRMVARYVDRPALLLWGVRCRRRFLGDGYIERLGDVLTRVIVDRQSGLTSKHHWLLKTRIEIGLLRAEVGQAKVGPRRISGILQAVFGHRKIVLRIGNVVRVARA